MLRIFLSLAALALLLASLAQAQSVRSPLLESPSQKAVEQTTQPVATINPTQPLHRQTGLLTTRLSQKDRVRWKAIEQLVFAQSKTGEPYHPILRELWHWADNSRHIIQVELLDSKTVQSSTAGSFNIERFDPAGQYHITSLKLYLSNIDQAVIGPQVARGNGFIPFDALRKEERYAEVLGHELAHVKYVLDNAMRTHLVHELVELTNDMLLLQARARPTALTSPEMKQRLNQRDQLLRELEAQAETIEEVVWRELIRSQKARGALKSRR
jgi:hypothetical protein